MCNVAGHSGSGDGPSGYRSGDDDDDVWGDGSSSDGGGHGAGQGDSLRELEREAAAREQRLFNVRATLAALGHVLRPAALQASSVPALTRTWLRRVATVTAWTWARKRRCSWASTSVRRPSGRGAAL